VVSHSLLGSQLVSPGTSHVRAENDSQPRPLALEGLFQGYYAAVWRLLRRFGVAAAQLDDAAQEVFWVAARRMADIQPGREKAFLYGVALRVASNELRRQNAAASLAAPVDCDELCLVDVAPSPEESLERRRALQLLDAVLARMPLELRTVFVLFELEGLEVSKIAELEELPLGTASSRLRRARLEFSAIAKRVRASLSGRGGSP
jgi:RNA polymerase sigma-70 factor (ECF subfamily)